MSKKTATEKNLAAKSSDGFWSPAVKIVAVVCAVILVLAVAYTVVVKNGVFEKRTVAMKIGDAEITAVEFNYTFNSILNEFYNNYNSYSYYYGKSFDFEASTEFMKANPCYYDSSKTWYEYFQDQTRKQLEEVYLVYNKAVSESMELSEDSRKSVDSSVESLKSTAAQYGYSLKDYLVRGYGRGMNEKLFRTYAERQLMASQYYTQYLEGLTYTDEQLQEKYDQDKNAFDLADYYSYTVTEKKTDDDSAEKEDLKAVADALMAAATDQEAFLAALKERVGESFEESTYLHKGVSYSDTDALNWVFDADRKAGDVTVIVGGTSESPTYTVLFMVSRYRPEYQLASMRHILLNVTDQTDESGAKKTDEDGNVLTNDAEQKAKAEELLNTWKANGGTEDAFAALVKENTGDTSSADNGGLYADFSQNYMVSEIDSWIWADGRKAGDCEIVKTTYGYHLVYFIGYGDVRWKNDVTAAKKTEDYEAMVEGLRNSTEIVFHEEAMKYVK